MDASKPIKWGICGVGNISQDFCANLCSLPPEKHKVVLLLSVNSVQIKLAINSQY